MRARIQPVKSLVGADAVFIDVSDSRVISGRAAVPAVAADEATGRAAQAEVPAQQGNVDSQVSFYDEKGNQLAAIRGKLTPTQYDAWNSGVVDDDAFFLECHIQQRGLTRV